MIPLGHCGIVLEIGLQADYDTEEAEKIAGESLARITPLAA